MLIKNRFGRIVAVSNEQAQEMLRKKEATLLDETPVVTVEEKVINMLECPYCGFIAKTPTGLAAHTRACKKKALLSQS